MCKYSNAPSSGDEQINKELKVCLCFVCVEGGRGYLWGEGGLCVCLCMCLSVCVFSNCQFLWNLTLTVHSKTYGQVQIILPNTRFYFHVFVQWDLAAHSMSMCHVYPIILVPVVEQIS